MEAYAKALLIGIPFFLVLIMIEILYGYFVKDLKYRTLDTVSSISSGITNILKDTLGLAVVLISYPFVLKHLAIFEIKSTLWIYIVAFIALDFGNYWQHRLSHKVNLFWNRHVIHHSSEEFNLACALRQPVSNLFGYFALFLIPAALMGVPFDVIALISPLHLFMQFWYHTQHIGNLGILEYVIVTPSQHRVHHAINKEYIDKNLSAIFCVWDRIFGTFQEELQEVKPVYGVLKPAKTWNPVIINFQHIFRLTRDAWHTKRLADKIRIWFMPTGWRPEDVMEKFPVEIITDPNDQVKYTRNCSTFFAWYSVLQLLFTSVFLLFMFANFNNLEYNQILLSGLFMLIAVFGYTSFMDGSVFATYFEILRGISGLVMAIFFSQLIGFAQISTIVHLLFIFYCIFTIFAVLYFNKNEKPYRSEQHTAS